MAGACGRGRLHRYIHSRTFTSRKYFFIIFRSWILFIFFLFFVLFRILFRIRILFRGLLLFFLRFVLCLILFIIFLLLTLIMIIFILCQHYCRLIITFCVTTLTLCLIFLIYLLTDAILNILLPQKICNNCYKSSYYNKKKKNGHKSAFNCVAIEGSVIILSFVVMIIMLLLNITIYGYIHQINMAAHFLLFLTFFHINYFI